MCEVVVASRVAPALPNAVVGRSSCGSSPSRCRMANTKTGAASCWGMERNERVCCCWSELSLVRQAGPALVIDRCLQSALLHFRGQLGCRCCLGSSSKGATSNENSEGTRARTVGAAACRCCRAFSASASTGMCLFCWMSAGRVLSLLRHVAHDRQMARQQRENRRMPDV